MIHIPDHANKSELFKYLRENKGLIRKQKFAAMKEADAVNFVSVDFNTDKGTATKAENLKPSILDADRYTGTVVINACNYLDSHLDVPINGIWKKTAKETKSGLFLQEHKMQLSNVVSDEVSVYVATMTWKELGYDYDGTTEVLINKFTAEKKRNPVMAEQYANGWVKQHSVGMQYVNYFLCMDSENKLDAEEKAAWDKYYPMVVNKEMADEYGFFFAVTEAKYIEGSAVVKGSNPATPTIMVEPLDDDTQQEEQTEEPTKSLDWSQIANALKQN